ncbi:MAG: hypothetical protein CYPHOPRED_001956 [Cyphobasidiales sp. Tagirdzhanova-0007]|nr:MAG: hypothetical protein CYPHOPRED_001956 [Cyphobasidiales sp. Tagirdzhanova-0007]
MTILDDSYSDLALPADTMALLQEFRDQKSESDRLETATAGPSAETRQPAISYPTYLELFKPAYRLSQFWYAQTTAESLAGEVARMCNPQTRLAFLCCPSGYAAFMALSKCTLSPEQVYLFEYDERFKRLAHSGFVKYDLNEPSEILLSQASESLQNAMDIIVVDPPYHAQASQRKISRFLPTLLRGKASKLIVLTGTSMGAHMEDIYMTAELQQSLGNFGETREGTKRMRLTRLKVEHGGVGGVGNQLQNPYSCWTSFEGSGAFTAI